MLLLLFAILPIWFIGFMLTYILSTERRLEVILPVSLFGSITLFIFILNLISYILHPPLGIYAVYVIFIILGLILLYFKKFIVTKIDIPTRFSRWLFYLSIFIWAIFLFQIIGHLGLSGDPTRYAIIAKSFTRGNFPVYSPWQPDIKLAYHYGPSIFLGVFHVLTGSSFDLIQRSTSFLIILMLTIFLVWVFKRHLTFKSLCIYQLIPLIVLLSLGNWMIAIPKFPLEFPQNYTGIMDWAAKLPTADIAFSTYGGAIVSLTGLIFFYHQLIGVISFIWILWLSFTYNKNRKFVVWTILTISIAALSIINELFLPLSITASGLVILCREFPFKSFISKKNILLIIFLLSILIGLVAFQGGVFTEAVIGKKSEYPSVQFFPDKNKVFVYNAVLDNYNNLLRVDKVNLKTFQLGQQASRLFFPTKEKWLPFIWFHPGIIFFYLANLVILFLLLIFKQKDKLLICLSLVVSAVCATVIYNLTFAIGNNSSRLLGFTYSFLGANLVLFLIWTFEYLTRNKRNAFIISALIIWLSIPSFFPTLAQLLISSEKNNKFITADRSTLNATEEWIIKNLPFDARLLFLSSTSLSPSTNIGIFMPIWLGAYRDYSMDNSPDYFDVIYTLNPTALKEFKMTHILIDTQAYSKLPEIRKEQLGSDKYFTLVYSTAWEKLYKINDEYLSESADLAGTFKELDKLIIPKKAKVYIDISPKGIEDRSKWESLKRALIFALKDQNLYFDNALPSENNSPYTHLEAKISGSEPSKFADYDYLALSYITDPKTVCDCNAEIAWKGFDNFIIIWKVYKN